MALSGDRLIKLLPVSLPIINFFSSVQICLFVCLCQAGWAGWLVILFEFELPIVTGLDMPNRNLLKHDCLAVHLCVCVSLTLSLSLSLSLSLPLNPSLYLSLPISLSLPMCLSSIFLALQLPVALDHNFLKKPCLFIHDLSVLLYGFLVHTGRCALASA